MNVAQSVRLMKEKHPERYCPKCLWRIVDRLGNPTPCPKHPGSAKPVATVEVA